MADSPDKKEPKNMKSGQIIIDSIIRANAVQYVEHPTPNSAIFVWQANAAEQIEAALHQAGYRLESIRSDALRLITCKCEVCDWIDDFTAECLNMEQCAYGFCEDCDQPRIFIPT